MNNITEIKKRPITTKDAVTLLICAALIGLFFVQGAGPLLGGTLIIVIGSLFTKRGRAFLASLGVIDFSNWKEALRVIFGGYGLIFIFHLFVLLIFTAAFFLLGGEIPTDFSSLDTADVTVRTTDLPFETTVSGDDETVFFDEGEGSIVAILGFAIALMVMTAVLEEIIFRGYLLTRLIGIFGDDKKELFLIVGITSLVFGAGHYYLTGIESFINATFFSILLSVIFIKYKFNLGYVIGIHALNNLIAVIGL